MTNSMVQSYLDPSCLIASIPEFPCYFWAIKMSAALHNTIIIKVNTMYSYNSSLNLVHVCNKGIQST